MKIFLRKNGLFFLFPLFLSLALGISSVQADKPKTQNSEKSQTNPSLHLQKLQSSNQKPIKDLPQEKGNSLREFFDVKITDVLLAFFTACLVLVGYWQIQRLKDTIDQMRRTEERQLRAYLGVRKVWIEDYFAFNSPFKVLSVKVEIENYGLTPASDASLECLIFHSTYPLEYSHIQSRELKKVCEKIPVMPRGEMMPILHFEVSTTEIEPLISKRKLREIPRGPEGLETVYLIGTIRYKDYLDKIQETKFLFYYNFHVSISTIPYEEKKFKWKSMAYYSEGNKIT